MILFYDFDSFTEQNESYSIFLLNKFHISPSNRIGQAVLDTFKEEIKKSFHSDCNKKYYEPNHPENKVLARVNVSANAAYKSIPDKLKRLSEIFLIYRAQKNLYFNTPSWFQMNVVKNNHSVDLLTKQSASPQWEKRDLENSDSQVYVSLFYPVNDFNYIINKTQRCVSLSTYIHNISNNSAEAISLVA